MSIDVSEEGKIKAKRQDIKILTPEQKHKLALLHEEKNRERMLKNGLRMFDINGVRVLALNRKNAERKAAKL